MIDFQLVDMLWFREHCIIVDPEKAFQRWVKWCQGREFNAANAALCRQKLLTLATGIDEQLVRNYCKGNGTQPNPRRKAMLADLDNVIGHPAAAAKRLERNREVRRIILLTHFDVPSIEYHFAVMRSICDDSARRNVDLKIQLLHTEVSKNDDEFARQIEAIGRDLDVDALLMLRLSPDDSVIELLKNARLPTVLIHADRRDYGVPIISNFVPDFRGVPEQLREWSQSLALGSKVVVVTAPVEGMSGSIRDERLHAIQSGLSDLSVTIQEIPHYSFHHAFTVFKEHPDAKAFVALSDSVALALKQISQIQNPDSDTLVIGFDGHQYQSEGEFPSFDQGLSTIGQNVVSELCDVLPKLDMDRCWFVEKTTPVVLTTSRVSRTHPKVASTNPTVWQKFPGFSLLFDHGPDHHREHDGVAQLEIRGDLPLYDALAERIEEACRNEPAFSQFCALPKESYHVTVWDGVNVENFDYLNDQGREVFREFISDPNTGIAKQSIPLPEMESESDVIRFEVGSVTARDGALVAYLAPVNRSDRQRFQIIEERRDILSERWHEQFGKPRLRPWEPHISLGYFGNLSAIEIHEPELWRIQKEIFDQVYGLRITCQRISLYGFSDMVTFFKTID